MIIDIHTHVFPPEFIRHRTDYASDDEGFRLLYGSLQSKMIPVEKMLESMDASGVEKSVIFGFPWKNDRISKTHNDYIIESIQQYPDRFIGFCCLDPFNSNAADEVIRCLDAGLTGVGEIAFYNRGLDDDVLESLKTIMKICLDRSVPVMIHTNEPIGHTYQGKAPITLLQIYNLARCYPDNKIILAHWGGGIFFYNALKKEVKESMQNIYFDTAASPFLYDSRVYKLAIELAGLEKILFGSDFPLISPTRYFKEIKSTELNQNEIDNICGNNAMKLLGRESK